jgi:chromosome partitioning protein
MTTEPRAVALAMLKGGFGKSTIANAISDALARRGHHVLLLDLDPDGHLSTGLGYYGRTTDGSDYRDVLLGDTLPTDIIRTTEYGFDLIPAVNLEQLNEDLARDQVMRSDEQLKRHLVDPLLGDEYDYILMDLPGTRNKITNNALVSSGNLLLPLAPVSEALNGLRQTTTKLVGPLRQYMDIEILAVIPNMLRRRIDHHTTDRELLESMNTSERFAAFLEAGRAADVGGTKLSPDVDAQTVLDQHIPPFARITQREWERIDRGETDPPAVPIRERAAFTRAYKERCPVSVYDADCDQLQYFETLATIVEEGGITQ